MKKDYEVGYGKPPKHSRFKPGQSGNPKGRAKNQPNMSTMLNAVLQEKVNVTQNGKSKKVSTETAILLRLREKALAGDLRSITTLFNLRAQYMGGEEQPAFIELPAEDLAILKEAGLLKGKEAGHE